MLKQTSWFLPLEWVVWPGDHVVESCGLELTAFFLPSSGINRFETTAGNKTEAVQPRDEGIMVGFICSVAGPAEAMLHKTAP